MKMIRILVTGGAGFIGKHLVNRLINLNHRVFVIDNLSASSLNTLPKQIKFIRADICQPDIYKLFDQLKPQVVYHLAADNRVTSSPEQTINSNVIGTFNVLKASQQSKVKQFIFTSSAAVYGESKNLPIKETHPTKPISAYGISKLTGELYCRLFQAYFATSIFRFANVYGPGQNNSSEGGVVAIFIDKFLNQQKPIIYGTGNQTRDFVYVDVVVDALVLALNKPQNFTLNIGSSQPTSIKKLLNLTAKLTSQKPRFIKKPKRSMEIEKSLFSHRLASQKINWHPKTDLASGLTQTIAYFKSL